MDTDDRTADGLFDEFLRRRESGEDLSIQDFCREHPEFEDVLLGLYSMHNDPAPSDNSTIGDLGAALGRPPEDTLDIPARSSGSSQADASGSDAATIDRYRIVREIGRGGFGSVYLAEQVEPIRRKVALKILKRGMDSEDFLRRFEAERQALARMDHDAVVGVLDAGTAEDGRAYLVMDFVDGEPLDEFLRENDLDVRQRLSLFVSICDGVHHAHSRAALIHRDLKPANILVRRGDEGEPLPRIIDFGLVKASDKGDQQGTLLTEVGTVLGTPAYMSPEQAGGDEVDMRADVYSLGVILYELLTGTLPIPPSVLMRSGLAEFPRTLVSVEPPSPRSRLEQLVRGKKLPEAPDPRRLPEETARRFRRNLRRDIDWIVMCALEKDRTRRYATVADLRDDVKRYLDGLGVRARPQSLPYRSRKFVRKHRVPVAFVAVVIGLLLGAWIVQWQVARSDRVARVRQSLADGSALWEKYRTLSVEAGERESRHDKLAWTEPTWRPVWERQAEIEDWLKLQDVENEIEDAFLTATQRLQEGLQVKVDLPDVQRVIRALLVEMGRTRSMEAIRQGGITLRPDFFRRLYRGVSGAERDTAPQGQVVAFQSNAPGADVYCFKYVRHPRETRLIPLPFDPGLANERVQDGIVGEPAVEVDRRWPAPAPFLPGDQLHTVGDQRIHTLTDLAEALKTAVADQPVEVTVIRDGGPTTLSWVPFPGEAAREFEEYEVGPGRLVHSFLQLGIRFAIYPLDCRPENHLGTVGEGGFNVSLPAGDYLLLFRKEGHTDTRFPLTVSGELRAAVVDVSLLPEEEIPDGCVFVPAGIVATGGDPEAFNPEKPGERSVGEFFIGRYEVTVREWLEFLNHPEIRADTDNDGMMKPRIPWIRDYLRETAEDDAELRLRVVPLADYATFLLDDRYLWTCAGTMFEKDWPVLGISHLAALEYLRWRTDEAKRQGKPWRYRLPKNLEWERAARGTDRRVYPWGNYGVWSFSWCVRGNFHEFPHVVGISPFDESPFGVRDMAGSVVEHTAEALPGTRNRFYRGGSWDLFDDLYLRVASRHSMEADADPRDSGLRVVVEVIPES